MKEERQNKIKAVVLAFLLGLGLELVIRFSVGFKEMTYLLLAVVAVLSPLVLIFLKVGVRSFAKINCAITAILFLAAATLVLIFVPGETYQQLYIGFVSVSFFLLVLKFIGMKVYEIQTMAYEQQYSLVDFVLLATSFLFSAGFFGLYLHFDNFPLWLLLILVFASNAVLFFLFFYFNDLWLKKIWLYVFVLTFIVLELTWALSFWPNGMLGRGIVLFFAYYLLSGLGKHYLKESFSVKVLREYLVIGAVVLALVLSTSQWTY